MEATSEPKPNVIKPRSNDPFVDYMLLNLQMTQESFNLLTARSDELVRAYLTTASAIIAALVLLIAAIVQISYLVFVALGTAGLILGLMGVISLLSWSSNRKKRLALARSLHQKHLFFAEANPVAFSEFDCVFQVSEMSGRWWPHWIPRAVAFVHCVIFALGCGLLVCALVLTNPGTPLWLNLWWIALATIILSGVLCAATEGMYRRIAPHPVEDLWQSEPSVPTSGAPVR